MNILVWFTLQISPIISLEKIPRSWILGSNGMYIFKTSDECCQIVFQKSCNHFYSHQQFRKMLIFCFLLLSENVVSYPHILKTVPA